MNYTEKYHLPQWVESDRILMTDFNQMCADIEAGLTEAEAGRSSLAESLAALAAGVGSAGENARIAWGSYTGTGAYGANSPTTLNVGFCPVLVVVGCVADAGYSNWPTVMFRDCPVSQSDFSHTNKLSVTWLDSGVRWYSADHAMGQNNNAGTMYYYCAIGYDKSAA